MIVQYLVHEAGPMHLNWSPRTLLDCERHLERNTNPRERMRSVYVAYISDRDSYSGKAMLQLEEAIEVACLSELGSEGCRFGAPKTDVENMAERRALSS